MLYRASDTIVTEHPELAEQARLIDAFLYARQGQVFLLTSAAGILDIESGTLNRLWGLYRTNGVIDRVKVLLCPEDHVVLEAGKYGELECDLCDNIYGPSECNEEVGYRVAPVSPITSSKSKGLFAHGHALLIGISAYRNLNSLRKTTTDAMDLYSLLIDPYRAGYPHENVLLLLDNEATKQSINDKLDWLARNVSKDDTLVVFFSGHGVQRVGGFEPGEFLCPVEADWYNLSSTAISTVELTTALRSIHAGRIVVLLDACHSGGVGEPKGATQEVQTGLSGAGYDLLAEGRGRVIIASCEPHEVSWELPEMRNGLFTHYVLEALRGAVNSGDGTVCILDLYSYVSKHVSKHKPQHPLLKGEISQNFALALVPQGTVSE